ncbi:MAG TPA: 5'-methylthioadenosine/S-adenosylhomocysteine nucleosidase [Aestuariivirgaceae bacterium]|jgi:adenosylhomocysteine nucleosidase
MTRIGGQRVLFVMAATAEYGVELKQRFTPLITGVGPVEAAAVTAASLSSLAAQEKLPDLVVSLGSAGSRTLEQGEIYQVSHVSYRDMDASALGFPKGETPFLDLPATVALPLQIPSIKSARLATGASIVNGAAYDLIESDMVDMETFAVLRAAMQFSVPLVGLRGISDGRQELRRYSDWSEYLQIIDERLAAAVDKLSTAIERNSLSPVR